MYWIPELVRDRPTRRSEIAPTSWEFPTTEHFAPETKQASTSRFVKLPSPIPILPGKQKVREVKFAQTFRTNTQEQKWASPAVPAGLAPSSNTPLKNLPGDHQIPPTYNTPPNPIRRPPLTQPPDHPTTRLPNHLTTPFNPPIRCSSPTLHPTTRPLHSPDPRHLQ